MRGLSRPIPAPGSLATGVGALPHRDPGRAVDAVLRVALADAQTNGGLLAAVAPERLEKVKALLADRGVAVAHVGEAAAAADGPGLDVA